MRLGWGGGALLISMNDGVSKVSLLGTVFVVVVGVGGEGWGRGVLLLSNDAV